MARVMIIGYGPLPEAGMPYISAPALRTRHLLKPILDAGHTVNLFTLPLPGTEGPEGEMSAMVPDRYEGLSYQRFTNHSGEFAIHALTEQVRQLEPDAIVGVNTYPSYVGARVAGVVPLWADLNGYWMAEMQGMCAMDQDDARLDSSWAIERAIVQRLDKFSAVSRPQLHAVIGEMGAVGRLNRFTFEYQFGHHIANAAYRWPEPTPAEGEEADPALTEPVLRGPIVPDDAFVILWTGGFNIWCDVPGLVDAMNRLMEHYPNVHFVCTGGGIKRIISKPFEQFESLVDQSPYKDRFHCLGWLESDKLPRVYREADVGINVDASNYETMFGARNRLNAMAAEGLALVSTVGTEISEWLDDGNALLSAPIGDSQALAEVIEPWIEQPEQLKMMGEKARRIMEEDFSYERTTRSLIHWLEAPGLSPDNQARIDLAEEPLTDLNAMALNALQEQALLLERHHPDELKEALAQVKRLSQKRLGRVLMGIKNHK